MKVPNSAESVTVEATAEDLLENTPTFHTDVDRDLIDKIPLESASSSVSSLVTLASPGVAADSNGLFHGLGDHAENSFSVDGQPITDQQSKVFSNQIPLDSIQSMEVISGAPPAEYGDKTSLVIDVTTRSGQGVTTPHGSLTAEYGSFGTSNVGFNLGYGGKNWGNFISANGLNTGRFLDPPEFTVMHDKGNEENVFDRVDYQILQQRLHPRQSAIHALLVPDAEFLRSAERHGVVRRGGRTTAASAPMACRLAPPISARRSRPSTLLRRGRTCSATRPCLPWEPLCGGMSTTTIPSANPFADLSPDLQSETRRPESNPDQCRPSFQPLVREGHPQPEGGRDLRTDVPGRARQPRDCRSNPDSGLHRSWKLDALPLC